MESTVTRTGRSRSRVPSPDLGGDAAGTRRSLAASESRQSGVDAPGVTLDGIPGFLMWDMWTAMHRSLLAIMELSVPTQIQKYSSQSRSHSLLTTLNVHALTLDMATPSNELPFSIPRDIFRNPHFTRAWGES